MMRNCSRLAQFHFQRLLFVQRLEYRQKNSITPKPIVRFLSLTIATLRMSQKKSKSSKKSLIETFVWTLPKIRTHHNQSSFLFRFSVQRLKVAATLCNELFSLNLLEYFQENVMDDSISDIADEIFTTFEETLVACSFQSKLSSCYPYFHDILTDEGKCFTFNLMSPAEIFRTE